MADAKHEWVFVSIEGEVKILRCMHCKHELKKKGSAFAWWLNNSSQVEEPACVTK